MQHIKPEKKIKKLDNNRVCVYLHLHRKLIVTVKLCCLATVLKILKTKTFTA